MEDKYMTYEELMNEKPVYVGACFAVILRERVDTTGWIPGTPKGSRTNPLVEIWVEDDETWFESDTFDAFWLDEWIKGLTAAKEKVVLEWPANQKSG